MKTDIYFKNYQSDDNMKEEITKKFKRLEKYFSENSQMKLTVSELRGLVTCEITVHMENNTYLRVEVRDKDLRTTIDLAVDKLEAQLKKYKTRLQRKDPDSIKYELIDEMEEDEMASIVKCKKFAIKPMSVEEASLQMELLGHLFYMFRNASTDEINVIYKRKDGNYGLIEPEV